MSDEPVDEKSDAVAEPEHVAVYLRFKSVFGDRTNRSATARKRNTKREGASAPFSPGRDPHGLAEVIDGLAAKMGWTSPLARSELLASWPEIVGFETAEHSTPARGNRQWNTYRLV